MLTKKILKLFFFRFCPIFVLYVKHWREKQILKVSWVSSKCQKYQKLYRKKIPNFWLCTIIKKNIFFICSYITSFKIFWKISAICVVSLWWLLVVIIYVYTKLKHWSLKIRMTMQVEIRVFGFIRILVRTKAKKIWWEKNGRKFIPNKDIKEKK